MDCAEHLQYVIACILILRLAGVAVSISLYLIPQTVQIRSITMYFHDVQMKGRDSLATGRHPANIHNYLRAVAHRSGGI